MDETRLEDDAQRLPVRAEAPLLPDLLQAEVDAAHAFAAAARAPATRRAYESDWKIFLAWCDTRGIEPLPASPAAVATFLASEAQAGVKPSTIGRRLAAIGYMHVNFGFLAPQQAEGAQAIRNVFSGIKRTITVNKDRKRAADGDMLGAIIGESPRAVRDRALLAIGMAGAFRRSELVALQHDEVEMVPPGIRITIAKSKTDQTGEGAPIAIPEGSRIRPKQLLQAWIALAGFDKGPVFRKLTPQGRITTKPMSDRGVALVVKAYAEAAGYDPAVFAGHSPRRVHRRVAAPMSSRCASRAGTSRSTCCRTMFATRNCSTITPGTVSSSGPGAR